MKSISLLILSLLLSNFASPALAEVKRAKFSNSGQNLIVEILDNDLIHFEFSTKKDNDNSFDLNTPLSTSP
ncbi:hypothetical protein NIES2101_19750, partial [Calothrix sp. HK-06]